MRKEPELSHCSGCPLSCMVLVLRPDFGSSSLEQDGSLGIVAMEEEEQAGLVHDQRLGKGQYHAHKTGQKLP